MATARNEDELRRGTERVIVAGSASENLCACSFERALPFVRTEEHPRVVATLVPDPDSGCSTDCDMRNAIDSSRGRCSRPVSIMTM